MALIIKNQGNTGIWCGQTINENSQYTVEAYELERWKVDAAVRGAVNTESLVINDGSNDLTVQQAQDYLDTVGVGDL